MKLLAIPGSHPCATVEAMLNAKRVEYDRVDLVPALSQLWLRLTGFDAGTVPAIRIDGARIQGSRAIARALEAAWPEPRLFPDTPAALERVEAIEEWGDGPLQGAARRIILWALVRSREGVRAALDGACVPVRIPDRLVIPLSMPTLRLDAMLNGARAAAVQADLGALPKMLDRVDGWIQEGDLGTPQPTAADYQLAGSLRLLLTIEDLAPLFADRPAAALANRLIPVFPGRVPSGVLPARWLP